MIKVHIPKFQLICLFIICIASAVLILPTINNNVNNPNAIVYFNHDEGYLMDLIWSYYSGEIRNSYQMSLDYGLEMVYLSDLSKLIFSKFINFTPGAFVLILRWINLIAWISALIALWFLVRCHFDKKWQPILAVLLLAVRPAFAYLANNLKPEPVVLLFIIIGLNYSLKIIEKPSIKYLVISIACASIAFIVKFSGIFLLPVIIGAVYFSNRNNKDYRFLHYKVRYPLAFLEIIALFLILSPFLAMFFYIRKTTGLTYYQEFGFLESLSKNKIIYFFWAIGIFFALVPGFIYLFKKSKRNYIKLGINIFNEVISYTVIVFGLFCAFVLIFGFRWLLIPMHFFDIYVTHIREFSGGEVLPNIHGLSGFLGIFLKNTACKLKSIDSILLLMMFFSFRYQKERNSGNKALFYKKMVLLIFMVPLFLSLFSVGRFAQHNMLPFIAVMIILAVSSLDVIKNSKVKFKRVMLSFIILFFIVDIGLNGIHVIKSRLYQFRQKEDICFDIEKWFEANVAKDTKIVADSYLRVYIPPQYSNIKSFRGDLKDGVEQFRYFVNVYRPQLIYYNTGCAGSEPMPPIEDMLPDKKVRPVRVFDSKNKYYQRHPNSKYVIYEVIHET